MQKYIIGFVALLLISTSFTADAQKKQVRLICEIDDCIAPLQLFRFDGMNFYPVIAAKKMENGYLFQVPESEPVFYYVGMNAKAATPLILGSEQKVVVTGECGKMRRVKINSPLNIAYNTLKQELKQYNNKKSSYVRQIQRTTNQKQIEGLKVKIKVIDDQQLALLDSLKKANPYFAKVAALNVFPSYENYGQKYTNGLDYFANEFFSFADFTEEVYGRLPWTYEAFKSYATTLSSVRLPDDKHKQIIEIALKRVPAKSDAYKLAIGGIIAALNQKNHANYVHFVELYIKDYKTIDPKNVSRLEREIQRKKQLIVGGQAPGFSGQTPSGETLTLSDFRGKIVLLDFWASWCGPCRRENPNVVKMYNKYKDQGFEIISISLDNNKGRWEAAIAKDKLDWHHISDLKKWQSEYAQLYGVRSIPHTVLLDKEGKIIARNLRGNALERKVGQVLGE